MVGPRFHRNLNFAKALLREKSDATRHKMIENATDDEVYALMDANYNILKFNFPLRSHQRRKLSNYAKTLRQLARRKSAKSGRKLLQTGNGIMFAALLAPVVAEIASSLISRIKQ